MTARTSIYNETDGIGAPKIWLKRLFQAGNRSSVDQICLPAAVRRKNLAGKADASRDFGAERLLHGKSQLNRALTANALIG
jgi:hypothetical protein